MCFALDISQALRYNLLKQISICLPRQTRKVALQSNASEKRFGKPDGSRTQTGFYRLFCVNTALKCLTIRQYSFTILPCLNKNQADINCKHLSVRSFCDNCAAIEAVWLAPINENAVKLAKKSKREAVWVRFPSGKPNSQLKTEN